MDTIASSAGPRCPSCGGEEFTFKLLVGPSAIQDEYTSQFASMETLKEQLSEVKEATRLHKENFTASVEESRLKARSESDRLCQELNDLEIKQRELTNKKEKAIAPLHAHAKQQAEQKYEKLVAEDPSLALYEDTEEKYTKEFFADLLSKALKHPALEQLNGEIHKLSSKINQIKVKIEAVKKSEDVDKQMLSSQRDDFLKEQEEKRKPLSKLLSETRKAMDTTELRCQTALMYCIKCGAPLGAVASPLSFDEQLSRLCRAVEDSSKTLSLQISEIKAEFDSSKKQAADGYASINKSIVNLGEIIQRVSSSNTAELAKALAGSMETMQKSMNALVKSSEHLKNNSRARMLGDISENYFEQ